jgi:TPR repeat protein
MLGCKAVRHVGLVASLLALVGCAAPQESTGPSIDQARTQSRAGNDAAAVSNLRVLAESGNPRAQIMLGVMYEAGSRVARDFSEASRLYELAATQNHAPAFALLGRMYETGRAGIYDLPTAIDLYERGIAAGEEWAAFFRGLQYETGEGARQNIGEAVRLYRMAAEQGNPRALIRLADLHMHGIGVEWDPTEARRLLERAAPYSEFARTLLARIQEMEG